MSNIVELTAGNLAFGPQDIDVMSAALEAVCRVLNIPEGTTARELIALRIFDLARRGERSCAALQERLLADARGGSGCLTRRSHETQSDKTAGRHAARRSRDARIL